MVLGIGEQDGPKPKCYFTHATLPTYIDNANPPAKKEPFKSTLSQQYNHTVRQESPLQDEATQIISILIPTTQLTLLLPTSPSQQTLHSKLSGDSSDDDDEGTLRYARVHMKPIDLISGDFFNSYIKAGNVVMLSEGRAGIDTVLSLCEGILRIEVDRSTFEKLGLEGKCEGGGEGRKHGRERFGESSCFSFSFSFPSNQFCLRVRHHPSQLTPPQQSNSTSASPPCSQGTKPSRACNGPSNTS